MFATIDDAVLLSKYSDSFADRETGERVDYYRATFQQGDSRPIEFSVPEDLFKSLERDKSYNVFVDVRQYQNGFRLRVSAAAALN